MVESAQPHIHMLIGRKYFPELDKLINSPPNPSLLSSLKNLRNLKEVSSVEDLKKLSELALSPLFTSSQKTLVENLYFARFINAAASNLHLKREDAMVAMQYLAQLQSQSELNPKNACEALISQITNSVMEINNFEEFYLWLDLNDLILEKEFTDFDLAITALENKFRTLISQLLSAEDVSKMRECMEHLAKVQSRWDVNSLKSMIGENILVYIRGKKEEASEEELFAFKQALDSMKDAEFDQDTNLRIEELANSLKIEIRQLSTEDFFLSRSLIPSEPIDFNYFQKCEELKNGLEIKETKYRFQHGSIWVNLLKATINHKGKKTTVAIKRYETANSEELKNYQREIGILKTLSESEMDGFLKLYGAYLEESPDQTLKYSLNIVMEYCKINLHEEIVKRKSENRPFSQEELNDMIFQLLSGFTFLQNKKINHLDVKPHNVLITEDNKYKIIDFNVSKAVENFCSTSTIHSTSEGTIVGTELYLAPELYEAYSKFKRNEGPRTTRHKPVLSDVFSLGLTFLEAASLDSRQFNARKYSNELVKVLDSLPYNGVTKNLLKCMLEFDPRKRLDFKNLLGMATGSTTQPN